MAIAYMVARARGSCIGQGLVVQCRTIGVTLMLRAMEPSRKTYDVAGELTLCKMIAKRSIDGEERSSMVYRGKRLKQA